MYNYYYVQIIYILCVYIYIFFFVSLIFTLHIKLLLNLFRDIKISKTRKERELTAIMNYDDNNGENILMHSLCLIN